MEIATIKLDDGREIGIAPVEPHEAMRLAEGCQELSGVRAWWRSAMLVSAVRTIDGIPNPAPRHVKHIEGLVGRFSNRDLKAISEAVDSSPVAEDKITLELAELTPVETLRTWAVIGSFEAIPGWVAPAFIAAAVRKIDGDSVSFPATKDEVRALVERLGVAGMTKASVFMLSNAAAEKAAEPDRVASAKNLVAER